MDLAIMIEGQDGLNWQRWQRIVRTVEDLGFAGLYRSDHFTNASAPDKDALEMWVSLTWLAANTIRIDFGPMVSPVSFRDPVFTARIGKDIDDLSGGRLHLGVGAGWQEREHEKFGYDLLDIDGRFERFEEGLEVISLLLESDDPVDFNGEFYELEEAILLPRPQRPGGPPILIGGNGEKRTLPLVAQYADMWNGLFVQPGQYAELNTKLDSLLMDENRAPGEVQRSLMTGLVYGASNAALQEKLASRKRTAAELRERGVIVGPSDEAIGHLKALEAVGCQRVMLQWLDLDDMDGLEALALEVLPEFR
jgi:F420-dependent oxidoreductase-like protein